MDRVLKGFLLLWNLINYNYFLRKVYVQTPLLVIKVPNIFYMFCFVFNGFCLTFRVAHVYGSITYVVLYLLVTFVVCMLTVLFFVCVIVHDTVFCDIQTDSPTYVYTCIHTYVQTDGQTRILSPLEERGYMSCYMSCHLEIIFWCSVCVVIIEPDSSKREKLQDGSNRFISGQKASKPSIFVLFIEMLKISKKSEV